MNNQKGFTLIELMIVIAIIGILAAVAIPAYQDYTSRARVSEAITALSAAKTTISENIINDGLSIGTNSCDGFSALSQATSNVASTACTNGVITATTTAAAGGFIITMTPTITGNSILWTCSAPAAQHSLVPAECRT